MCGILAAMARLFNCEARARCSATAGCVLSARPSLCILSCKPFSATSYRDSNTAKSSGSSLISRGVTTGLICRLMPLKKKI